jgi:hypothetical protein
MRNKPSGIGKGMISAQKLQSPLISFKTGNHFETQEKMPTQSDICGSVSNFLQSTIKTTQSPESKGRVPVLKKKHLIKSSSSSLIKKDWLVRDKSINTKPSV